jgi:8-oxo-dGTP diphosphatase
MAAKIVVAVITRDDMVLLVRRRRPEGDLSWVFPGGAVEPGETEIQAVEREVREEAGLEVRARSSLASVSTPTPTGCLPIGSASLHLESAVCDTG